MPTTNYNLDYWDDSWTTNIVKDMNFSLDEVDAALKGVSDAAALALSGEHDARILSEAGIVSDLGADISTATSNLLDRLVRRDEFAGSNCVMIGDSYTYGTGSNTHSTVTYTGHRSTNDPERWSSLFCSMLGMTEFNFAVGGTGFIDDVASTGFFPGEDCRFIKQLDWALAEMTDEELADVRMVVIAGGINDVGFSGSTGALMQSASQTICEYAKSVFPNALIVLIPMLWYGAGWDMTAYNYWMRLKLGGMAAGANVLVIDNAWTWLFGWSWWSGIHPNGTGHYRIAQFAISGLNGGNTQGNGWDTPTFESGWSNYSDSYFVFENGQVSMLPCYVNGGLSAGTTKIATAPAFAVPRTNVYIPIVKGNDIVGALGIVAGSGSMNATVSSSVSSGFYLAGGTWMPHGI